MKKLIIYDLDGTLIDTRADIVLSVQHTLTVMGAKEMTAEEIESFVGRGLHYLIGNCLRTEDKAEIERGADHFKEYYGLHMMDHAKVYPGGIEMLEYFGDRKQALVTNKPDPFTNEMLKGLKVAQFFCAIIPGNSTFPRKPNPQSILTIMRDHGIEADDAVFVGDSLIDIETGRNAGILTSVITHGFNSEDELKSMAPDLLFQDLQEFLKWAKQNNW